MVVLICPINSNKQMTRYILFPVIYEALMGASSSLTEQQEQLKLIHEKFKDEINQHIQDSRSSIEGLEVHQLELMRNLERQSMTLYLVNLLYLLEYCSSLFEV